jgi:hypothetical protein
MKERKKGIVESGRKCTNREGKDNLKRGMGSVRRERNTRQNEIKKDEAR